MVHTDHYHKKISPKTMNPIRSLFLITLIVTTTPLTTATQPDSSGKSTHKGKPDNQKGGGNDGFFGFGIPGFENGWSDGNIGGGYGSGYGGPKGGHNTNGVIRPSVVCKDKGPCYNKKLTCPAKCFKSFSRSGKGGGGGGGGGGCTMDCKKRCVAYC